ncbi:tetratricopeptide repeat protein 12-like, partial [Scleropages formosus]
MQELSSSNVTRQKEAVEKADYLLSLWEDEEPCRTRLNRTVSNTRPSSPKIGQAVLPVAEFTSAPYSAKNHTFRMSGNEAFTQGDYEAAVQQYSAGLDVLRDAETLYTNRAQAFIKLQKYKEAISDCDWALKARACYQRILEIEPDRAAMVQEYLTRVDLQEKKDIQEKEAWEQLDKGNKGAVCVCELLKNLHKSAETIQYYFGGVELLTNAVVDCAGQTLFRLHNGFSIINNNNTLSLTEFSSTIYGRAVCFSAQAMDSKENQQVLIQCPSSREHIVNLLGSGKGSIREACLALLCLYVETQYGRHLVIENLNMPMLVENLWKCLSGTPSSQTSALGILEHLAEEPRNITESNQEWFPQLVSVMGRMATDDVIRKEAACCLECWDAFLIAMERCTEGNYRDVLYSLLGLMINLSSKPSPAVQECAGMAGRRCMDLLSDPDGGIITRSAGLLSTLLPHSPAAAQEVTQAGAVQKLLKLLKAQNVGQTTTRFSIKALAVCTARSQDARAQLLALDKRMRVLRRLLAGSDEVAMGNAALCLGHCVEERGAASALLGSDVVPLLLRLAGGDAGGAGVQQNGAVALGKLCNAEPRPSAGGSLAESNDTQEEKDKNKIPQLAFHMNFILVRMREEQHPALCCQDLQHIRLSLQSTPFIPLEEHQEQEKKGENKDDEKDNLIQHSKKMVMKSDLSQSESLTLQMSHDTLEESKSEDVPHGKHFRRAIVAGSESQSAIMVQNMRLLSPGLFLSGLADVSDDDCGTGNYTAEMSLSLDSEILPGDSIPALGNLHVVISLKTNSSQANLTIKSCCISPSAQPDQLNATCCLFSRLPIDPRGIMLLPSDLSSSASFTIRLFQMTNHSTAYLHCDLSVCPRNHTDCE